MEYVLILLLLGISAFFSASEASLFGIGRAARARLARSGDAAERAIARLIEQPRDLLAAVLLGNGLTNIALSVVAATAVSHLLAGAPLAAQVVLTAALLVPLLLLCGEVTPKSIAAQRAEPVARALARPLHAFYRAVGPLRIGLGRLTDALVRRLGGAAGSPGERTIDEREFRTLVDVGVEEGFVEAQEQTLINNVLDFDDLVVTDVMRPFEQVLVLDERLPIEQAIAQVAEHNFSRVPVCRGQRHEIVGVVYAKDLLAIRWGVRRPATLRALMRRPVFTPPQKQATALLDEFRRMRTHMAIVVDERGAAVGLCTMEDLLEELFGPITDSQTASGDLAAVEAPGA